MKGRRESTRVGSVEKYQNGLYLRPSGFQWGLTIELSGRTKPMSAVPGADHNLAATGTARSPDAVRLNEGLGPNASLRFPRLCRL